MLANRSCQFIIRGSLGVKSGRISRACMALSASTSVAVLTTKACPYCRRAKSALLERGVAFTEIDASSPELRAAAFTATGSKTVPQIFIRGKSIGGCDSLLEQLEAGAFQREVEEAEKYGSAPLPPSLSALILEAKGAPDSDKDGSEEISSLSLIFEGIGRISGHPKP